MNLAVLTQESDGGVVAESLSDGREEEDKL